MITKDFIIGGDPEFFCKNNRTGEYISLIPYIEGTKKKPQDININGCSQLRDGVSIELNLPPLPEFWMLHRIISDCIEYTNNWLKKIDPDYILDITSSAVFNENQLKHREARTFGCEPAYNAYTLQECYRPEANTLNGLRTASYHIHYGWDKELSAEELRKFIFLNDLFLGFPAMYLDHTDRARKEVYGQLGEHRIKKSRMHYYDITENNRIEYRTLGAGIHQFPGFVENGIKLIKDNLENMEFFIDLYYKDFEKLSINSYDEKLKEVIKQKIIKNGHFNR
jgi:hypothetical protein